MYEGRNDLERRDGGMKCNRLKDFGQMILRYDDRPKEYARDAKAMEIFKNAIDNAGWLDENDSLASGDVVGFDFGDDRVRATVDMRKDSIEIHMVSPLKYDYARSWHQSFFSRNNWLHDDAKVKAAVHGALTELYYDYAMVKSRKDDLVAHSRGYRSFRESFLEQERKRILDAKKECAEVSKTSGQLKRDFKAGKYTEKEYVALRAPVHERIVRLLAESEIRDPFHLYFREYLDLCRFALYPELIIRHFISDMEGDDAAGLSDVNDYGPVENIRRLLDGRDSRKDLIRFKTADRPQLLSATHRVWLPRSHQSMITAVPEAVTMSMPLSAPSVS